MACVLVVALTYFWGASCYDRYSRFHNMEESHITDASEASLHWRDSVLTWCGGEMEMREPYWDERVCLAPLRSVSATKNATNGAFFPSYRLRWIIQSETMIRYPILFYDVKHGHGDGEEGLACLGEAMMMADGRCCYCEIRVRYPCWSASMSTRSKGGDCLECSAMPCRSWGKRVDRCWAFTMHEKIFNNNN